MDVIPIIKILPLVSFPFYVGNTSLHEALLSLSSSFTKQVKEVAKVLMRYGARSGILNH